MSSLLQILSKDQLLGQIQINLQQLNKIYIETILKDKYSLEQDYEITYTDADGDEIMVQFEQDYEVARMTVDQQTLILKVKVQNQNWLRDIQDTRSYQVKRQQLTQNTNMNSNFIQSEMKLLEVNPNQNIFDQLLQIRQDLQQPKELNLALGQIQQPQCPIQKKQSSSQDSSKPLADYLSERQLDMSQSKTKKVNSKFQSLKTQTQSQDSQLEQEDEAQIKAKLILQQKQQKGNKEENLNLNERNQLVNKDQQIVKQKNNLINQNAYSKLNSKKQKKNKAKNQNTKPQLTEKDIKKLIKKEIFRLIPQIQERLLTKKEVEVKPQKKPKKDKSNIIIEKQSRKKCTKCEKSLTVPFYINSVNKLTLCQVCEREDCGDIPLVKIRDQNMLQSLVWAEPINISNKQIQFQEQKNPVKFYTHLMKHILKGVKDEFNERIQKTKLQRAQKMDKKQSRKQLNQSTD